MDAMSLSQQEWNQLWEDLVNARNDLLFLCDDLPFWADSEPCRGLVDQVDRSVLDRQQSLRRQAAAGGPSADAVFRLLYTTKQTLEAAAKDIGGSLTWKAAWDQIGAQTGRDVTAGALAGAGATLPVGLGLAAAAAFFFLRR